MLNTDRSNFPGTHWWSILNILPKKQLFLFDSYGFIGFKVLIEQDDSNIINIILRNAKEFNKDGSIVTLITVTFSRENYEKLSQNEILKLSSMGANLFHLINEFQEVNKIKNEVILHFVNDQLQNETSDTCGIFQLYFYKNLSDPLKKSKIINDDKLTKNTILTLFNKIFSTSDKKMNK